MLTWLPERIKPQDKSALIRRKAEEAWQEMSELILHPVDKEILYSSR
jgi:hypothetical protein